MGTSTMEQEAATVSPSRSGTAIRPRRVVTAVVTQPDRRASGRVRHGVVAGLVVAQAGLVALTLLPAGPVLWTGLEAIALLLAVVGIAVGGMGLIALGTDARLGPFPARRGRLHRHGIYAVVRHPMDLGLGLAATAFAAASGRLLGLVVLGLLIGVLVVHARVEDRLLQRTYGWEYALYAERVPAIVPRPRRARRR